MMDHDQQTGSASEQSTERVPLLSVTVLNYNYAHYLPQCLDSILRQTFTDFELLLINDRSTDNSLEVIQPYLADPRVTLINHQQNKGYIASLIEGSERSRGKYLTVISADDFCVSDRAFETLIGTMEHDSGVVLGYAAFGHYGADGVCSYHRLPHAQSYVRSGEAEFRELVLENYILHSGTIIRRTAYDGVGGYDDSTRFAPDRAMWLRLCSQGKVTYCAEELYAYRTHVSSMSVSLAGIRDGLTESMRAVISSFKYMGGTIEADRSLYVRALRLNLSAVATDNVFAGHVRNGWYAFWCGARMHPYWTVFQRRTLILVARTVLGSRPYSVLWALARRNKQSAELALQPATTK
jgi:glycosyltransferase involved in cell wall biosynthesis